MFQAIELNFDIQEVTLAHPICKQLLSDFSNFSNNKQQESPKPHIKIHISQFLATDISKTKMLPFFWQRKNVKIFGWRQEKYVFTRSGSYLHIDYKSWSIMISLAPQEKDYEEFYLLILSVLSERLEKQGWLRLHAASMTLRNRNFLLNWPPGFGKSSCTVELYQNHSAKVYSDETSWIFQNKLQVFPLRISLPEEASCRRKIKIFGSKKYSFFPEDWGTSSSEVSLIFFPLILNSKIISFFWFFISNCLGLGLAQMAPYTLRTNNLCFIVTVFFRRLNLLFSFRNSIRFLKLKQRQPQHNLGLVLSYLSET